MLIEHVVLTASSVVWPVNTRGSRRHSAHHVRQRSVSRRDCTQHGRSKRGGLGRPGDGNLAPCHVRIDLHEQRVPREPATADDRIDRETLVGERLDDRSGAKRGRLNQRVKNLFGTRAERDAQ